MVADSVISFYAGNGHDGNIAVYVGESVFILEFERIFGSRYFTRLLNPFSRHSQGVSNEDIVNFLDYINTILIDKGIFVSSFDIGLFDWWILSRARNNRWNRKTLQYDYCMVSKWGNDWKIS